MQSQKIFADLTRMFSFSAFIHAIRLVVHRAQWMIRVRHMVGHFVHANAIVVLHPLLAIVLALKRIARLRLRSDVVVLRLNDRERHLRLSDWRRLVWKRLGRGRRRI